MVRADADGPATDPRALAAGFLTLVELLAREVPVLIAIDDLQWLDPSSANVMAYAARRLKGRVGVLATVRTEVGAKQPASWLQMPRPGDLRRIEVPALTLGGLQHVLSEHLGRSFPRPTMVRIQEVSGGNPFYALELARAIARDPDTVDLRLPGTLAELVHAQIGSLGSDVQDVLLAAACAAAPTVELVADATGRNADDVTALLEPAEADGIIAIVGHRLRFAHPLLARGVYGFASPAQRRGMHRRLAGIVTEPELRARHLALASTTGDLLTLRALDEAAEIADRRGAPAAAAELLGLARGLGGDTYERRIGAARHLLAAGDSPRAVSILEEAIVDMQPGPLRAEALSLLGFGHIFHDGLIEAVECFERAMAEVGDNLVVRVQTLIALTFVLIVAGRFGDARRAVDDAVSHATHLGHPSLLSPALSASAMVRMLQGEGYDEVTMQRALELDDGNADNPVVLRPRFHYALLSSWIGRFDRARAAMAAVREDCVERGDEYDLAAITMWHMQLQIWRGDFSAAAAVAEDSYVRGLLLGGDEMFGISRINKCLEAAYAGRVEEARSCAADGIAACQRYGGLAFVTWGKVSLGFLEVSLGNYEAALATLAPLILAQDAAPEATEIYLAWFVPDAVESLIQLGRLDEAETLLERLERNGRRLDRPWMLAMGARGRAMLLAANGDLEAASLVAGQAMVEHDRLPMPFERARTQLLVGQLQRRQRQKSGAAATLGEALRTFENLRTPLWADRTHAELARVNVGAGQGGLTPSEQRVAECVASGMTNRDVAAALFISPKTVESNLSRIYQKLNIRSRTELVRRMGNSSH
jgi:DNA-binding CsgD family transcriptional regulator